MTEFWVRADLENAAFRREELRKFQLPLGMRGMFQRAEDLTEVECDACGERHTEYVHVVIEPAGSLPRRYIVCKESGRVGVASERVEVQRIDFDGLASTITNLLGMGAPRPIVEGRLWLLDTIQLGGHTRDIFFVRGARWADGLLLANQARIVASRRPLILVPNSLPDHPEWVVRERIFISMSEFDWFGDQRHNVLDRITSIAAEHDHRTASGALFRKEGEIWTLSFGDKEIHVEDMVGLGYIADLLRKPRVAIEAAQLAGASDVSAKHVTTPGIPLSDKVAIRAVRAELLKKRAELEGIKQRDWARKGPLKEEILQIEKYLGEVQTNRGQARKVAGTAQRARTAVTNAIKRAIARIQAQHPDLGRHLEESIRTGTSPMYAPSDLPVWQF